MALVPKLLAALALSASASISRAEIVTFEDDRFVTHTWDNSKKAKICTRAGVGGLSLHQLGMQSDQLYCYYGLWGIRGSDFDPENPDVGSIYPEADPTPDEATFFKDAINLSPGCWKNPRGCFRWDEGLDDEIRNMVNTSQIDFIVTIDNGNDAQMKALEQDLGYRTIFVDTFYEKNPDCRAENYTLIDESKCYGRSMIDIAARVEELAIFLGVDVDVPAQEAAKREACEAAADFTDSMKEVQEKDMRIKVSILGSTEVDGENVPYARDFDPITLWVPRTLEELGAPLLHAKVYNSSAGENRNIVPDVFWPDCSPGLVNDTCSDNTYHPVDFWLIDSRSYLVLSDWVEFGIFPDPAIAAGQYSYYPRNDGAISFKMIANLLSKCPRLREHSYHHSDSSYAMIARNSLDMYNQKISAAAKVSKSDPGTCKPVDPKSSEIISKDGGLDLNDFICYNYDLIQQEYLTCPPPPEVVPETKPTEVVPETKPTESVPEPKASSESGGVDRTTSRFLAFAVVSAGTYLLSSA
ncbi:hypothetical protein THAOC_08758 [Thalassiosira oceanica]|uniref:Glycoside-hydrolase family GH114 TIM-barrel domain-containing protein n=1 Tax=Thalassiosira oceanica TaxID=159749 RepID=K0T931_THAOC|nr:hypothetical protein THAOC_08758 [Thalassiosira oceanica]|eukprot:EJK69936.1 hypothetical protein THAOC_08758 [Thalassiosira oceanica]